ncbi:MAG: alpha/beta hydrolase [Gammaproteobacteria bacterium]|nr:alpha/beta hydrolase [Gammaproteobacteria bacterium]
MQLDYSNIDDELAVALELLPEGLEGINRDNIVAIREMLAAQAVPPVETDVTIEERTVTGADGDVRVLVYRPPEQTDGAGVLWIHGGGYIFGSAEDDRARIMAEELGCTVVSVDYRLAPENPFPAGVEDCYASLVWMTEHAADLNIDHSRIAIGGASAGAGMAAGLALLNRDRGGPQLALQLLLYPMIDNLHDTVSGQFVNHPVWNQQTSFNAWEMYLNGTPGVEASPYAAASRAADLANLPPAYICVGSEDLFRDECIDYARRLIAAGVPSELAVFPGVFHAAEVFVPQAKVSQRLHVSFMRALRDMLA